MHHTSRTVIAAVLALLAVSVLPAQTLYSIGDLSGGIYWSQVRDVTKTGGVIYAVGSSAANTGSAAGDTAILWTSTGGLSAIPNLNTSNTNGTAFVTASDITPDAAYIAGRSFSNPSGNARQAVRVTTSGLSLTSLATPGGFAPQIAANAVSDNGSIAYGFGNYGGGNLQAIRFDVLGATATAIPFASVGDVISLPTARAVSGNGNLVLGTSSSNLATNGTGSGSRAFIYNDTNTSVSLLPLLSGGTWSQGVAMNSTGTLSLLGGDTATNANGVLYLTDGSTTTSLGTPDVTLGLNVLGGMTSDGSVVGFDWTTMTGSQSFIYNANGWQDLYSVAAASGADLTGWTALHLTGISEDGTLVWGDGTHNGNNEGYVLEFSAGYLSAVAIPEPSTYAALAGLGALGLAFWRRRAAA